jgi:hypothetical protein
MVRSEMVRGLVAIVPSTVPVGIPTSVRALETELRRALSSVLR